MLLQVTASSLDRMTMPSPHRLWPVHICGSKELPHMQHTATARRSTAALLGRREGPRATRAHSSGPYTRSSIQRSRVKGVTSFPPTGSYGWAGRRVADGAGPQLPGRGLKGCPSRVVLCIPR